jgi:hypothetical protein
MKLCLLKKLDTKKRASAKGVRWILLSNELMDLFFLQVLSLRNKCKTGVDIYGRVFPARWGENFRPDPRLVWTVLYDDIG